MGAHALHCTACPHGPNALTRLPPRPCAQGGLRFHPSVNESIIKFLGFEQIFK